MYVYKIYNVIVSLNQCNKTYPSYQATIKEEPRKQDNN